MLKRKLRSRQITAAELWGSILRPYRPYVIRASNWPAVPTRAFKPRLVGWILWTSLSSTITVNNALYLVYNINVKIHYLICVVNGMMGPFVYLPIIKDSNLTSLVMHYTIVQTFVVWVHLVIIWLCMSCYLAMSLALNRGIREHWRYQMVRLEILRATLYK